MQIDTDTVLLAAASALGAVKAVRALVPRFRSLALRTSPTWDDRLVAYVDDLAAVIVVVLTLVVGQ